MKGKLVRDKIPVLPTTQLPENLYKIALYDKLQEEVQELLETKQKKKRIEEIADVLEVLEAIMDLHNISRVDVNTVKVNKSVKKGGFVERKYWVYEG